MVYNHYTNRIFFHSGYEVPYIDLWHTIPQGSYATLVLFINIPDIDKKIFKMAGLPPPRRIFPSPMKEGQEMPKYPHPLAMIIKNKEMQTFFMLKFRRQQIQRLLYPPGYHWSMPQQRKFKAKINARQWQEYKTTYYQLCVARTLAGLPLPHPPIPPPLYWFIPFPPHPLPPPPPPYWRAPLQWIQQEQIPPPPPPLLPPPI